MPNWLEVCDEIRESGGLSDTVRHKYLGKLSEHTGRNVICYYSGWMQKPDYAAGVDEEDKNAFMTVIHRMDRSKGLDLMLHTPGGSIVATESLIEYIMKMFNYDVRAIVPQLSMSAGTILACSCKSIVMGKQSSLGPIDPYLGTFSCARILKEFDIACDSVNKNPGYVEVWRSIIGRYHPTLLVNCIDSIEMTKEICAQSLKNNMMKEDGSKADDVVANLIDSNESREHGRHRGMDYCKDIGLKIEMLEDDDDLQDLVLTLHHSYMFTLTNTPAFKIIENQNKITIVKNVR